MGRVREMINVNGRDRWTLFDTGARNTYIVPAVASVLATTKAHRPYRTALVLQPHFVRSRSPTAPKPLTGGLQRRLRPVGRAVGGVGRPSPNPSAVVVLGGEVKVATETAVLEADVEGHAISTHAMVVDEIGKDIEVLLGALAMQQWGIRPIPDEEKLDLSHYPEEFVEF